MADYRAKDPYWHESAAGQAPSKEQTPGEAQQDVKRSADKAKEAGQKAFEKTSQEAEKFVSTQREQVSDQVSSVGNALHQVAEKMEGENPTVAKYAHQTASGLDRISSRIKEKDLSVLRGDVENFARSHSETFLAGTFIGGLLLGRFLKSSQKHQR